MPTPFTGSRYFNLISDISYNLTNDVVLSIEYSLSGNPTTEAGFSFFITTSAAIDGGGSGIGLAYKGEVVSTEGIPSSIAGIGLDTGGYFGLSGTDMDGVHDSARISNAVCARAGYDEQFSMVALGTYYRALPTGVVIVNSDIQFRSLRYRVGNLGRTMYLDYRANHDDDYIALAEVDIGDRVDITLPYRVGIGYTAPLVGSSTDDIIPVFNLRSIHIEGLDFDA
jgi:hypothetical protein